MINLFKIALWVVVMFSTTMAWAKVNVVSTLPDYGALVQMLGGDHVNVRSLSSPLEDPHYVDAKPSFIVALNRADLVIANGLELEIGWLPNLIDQSRNPGIQLGQPGFFEVAAFVPDLLEVVRGSLDRSMGDIHPGGNPHYYHDPRRMGVLLPALAKRLIALDPTNRAEYEQNLKQAQAEFTAFVKEIRLKFAKLPPEQRRVVAYHKSLSYLLDTLGVTVVAHLEPKPGVAPTPGHVAKILSLMKRENIGIIIHEEHYPAKTSETLAKLVGGRVVKMVGGTQEGETYLTHIRKITDNLYKALARKAS